MKVGSNDESGFKANAPRKMETGFTADRPPAEEAVEWSRRGDAEFPLLRLVLRPFVILVTAAACVGGGAAAGLAASGSLLDWPLSVANFAYVARLGGTCGAGGALIAVVCF